MIINAGNLRSIFTAFGAAFNKALTSAPSHWAEVAMKVPSVTLEEEYGWLADMPLILEWIGERVIQNLSVRGYAIRNRLFESTVSVDRTSIEDDRFGVFAPRFEQMGRTTAIFPDQLIFSLLAAGFSTFCYDGQYFFDTDHPVGPQSVPVSNILAPPQGTAPGPAWYLLDCSQPVKPMVYQERIPFNFTSLTLENDPDVFFRDQYIYGVRGRCNVGYGLWQLAFGSTAPLTSDNYAACRAAMQSQQSDSGRPLGVSPTHLVMPPALERDARRLLVSGLTNRWRRRTASPRPPPSPTNGPEAPSSS